MSARHRTKKQRALRAKALELLRSAYFFVELLRALRRIGLVGEKRAALAVYIVATSRLLAKPLCLFVKGSSGAGKNFLVDTVLRFIPPSEVLVFTSSSNRAWNFMGNMLAHRIVYQKERNEASGPVHPTRLLISEGQLTHDTVGRKGDRFSHERRTTKGPIAAISTTTKDMVEIDDETRHISLWVDESPKQTRRITKANFESIKPLSDQEIGVWREAQRLIAERADCIVCFPAWFEEACLSVTSTNLSVRRYFQAFLQACRTVTLIHSFRHHPLKLDKETKLTVRFSDFAVASLIFNEIFTQSMHRADDEDLDVRREARAISSDNGGNGVSARELSKKRSISLDRAYALLRKATKAGTIHQVNRPTKTNLKLFLPTDQRTFLPEPHEIFHKLDSLPERVKFVDPLSGNWIVYGRDSEEEAE